MKLIVSNMAAENYGMDANSSTEDKLPSLQNLLSSVTQARRSNSKVSRPS
jgi:hypothetical protein